MKKFTFKLQRLLEIRERLEEEARVELAKASGDYQIVLNRKNKAIQSVQHARSESETKLSFENLRNYDLLQQETDRAILEIDKELEGKREIMEQKKAVYVKKKQDKRAVEILKEKALARYQEEESREEQKNLDEIGKNVFLKNNKSL